jgi:histidinol-phosphate aminotransferase
MPISRRDFVRRSVAAIPLGIVPGTFVERLRQPSRLRSERASRDTPIYLDQNENAFGPSDMVHAALTSSSAAGGNRYAREQYDALRSGLATLHSIEENHVLLGCGSSEILRLVATTLVRDTKKSLIQAAPTYPLIGRYARAIGANVIETPLTKTYSHDLEQMLRITRKVNTSGVIYICNPNNPTGTLTDRVDIEQFVRALPKDFWVLIDEAYCHFVSPHATYASFLDKPLIDPRVIVCRTFSKVYGLAGMRIGYAVCHPENLKMLEATQLPYGVATPSSIAALAALEDKAYVRAAVARTADIRQEFMNQVNIRMLRAINSHANFVMLDPLRPADTVLEHLRAHNVFVAPVVPMDKYIRVSLGNPDEMREFWRVMDLLPPTGKMAM